MSYYGEVQPAIPKHIPVIEGERGMQFNGHKNAVHEAQLVKVNTQNGLGGVRVLFFEEKLDPGIVSVSTKKALVKPPDVPSVRGELPVGTIIPFTHLCPFTGTEKSGAVVLAQQYSFYSKDLLQSLADILRGQLQIKFSSESAEAFSY